MNKKSFDTLRSMSIQLHHKVSREKEYESYLKRVSSIVDRKHSIDTSSQFYMTFLQKCRSQSKSLIDKELAQKNKNENEMLLNKIVKSQSHKYSIPTKVYEVHVEQKRRKENEIIKAENIRISQKIKQQNSTLKRSFFTKQNWTNTWKKAGAQSKITLKSKQNKQNERKLPKLVTRPEFQYQKHAVTLNSKRKMEQSSMK